MIRTTPNTATSYQDLISRIRRFDRDSSIVRLSALSQNWTGQVTDINGHTGPLLPWSISGVAALFITRGTQSGSIPTDTQLEQLCSHFLHLAVASGPLDEDYLIRLVGRIMHEQFPFQRLGMSEWARPIALYQDTSFKIGYKPEVMTPGWDVELMGCSIADFVSTGFCLHTAANTGGRYPIQWTPGLKKATALHGGSTAFNRIVTSNFLTDIANVKKERIGALDRMGMSPGKRFLHEPFSYNPLLARPFVGGIVKDEWIAPSVPLIQMRSSPLGIIYSGLDRWGTAFTRDAGNLFEQYVGRQLALMPSEALLPEIDFGTKNKT
ncbi:MULTISPECIES: hypothetical protein [unclassified Rathayibacter]|uniref:hypothetical protein n=1 Tax=unclassified Rathayibacter TaxID=2609250 RepID=UPI0010502381|nr:MULTISPECIES: hypothetical protein [unclassified Rathayibacter]